jgi:hypothetical protein
MKMMNYVLGIVAVGGLVACGGPEEFDESANELIAWGSLDNITSTGSHGSGGLYEACTADYTAASAKFFVYEGIFTEKTWVLINVKDAEPSHLHTLWLKVDGASPLTGIGATPGAGFDDYDAIQANDGTAVAVGNGFATNGDGDGHLWTRFDYHLSDGTIPFSDYTGNPDDDRGVGSSPFTFRVISHCTDGIAHGLLPGPHEPQFQTSL